MMVAAMRGEPLQAICRRFPVAHPPGWQ